MKKVIIAMLVIALVAPFCSAADKDEKQTSEKVAASYFEALMGGDVEKANDLSAAPFYFDGKEVLRTMDEVKEKHRAILDKKGKRKVPEYTLKTLEKGSPLDSKVFPEHVVVSVTIAEKNESINVYVSKGETPKVIGFRD